MKTRISNCLLNAGMTEVPESAEMSLSEWGLDSLVMVKALIEFENEFSIRVSADDFSEEAFETLNTLENYLKSLGAS